MDNRKIDVVSEGKESLAAAMKLAWHAPGGKATHYRIMNLLEKVDYYGTPTNRHITSLQEAEKGTPTLILLWHAESGALPLPYPLEFDAAVAFVEGWLKTADRGAEPDHDGDNGHGWRLFTENWGHVAGHQYAILAAQPAWAMYGK